MTRSLCLFTLLLGATNANADPLSDPAAQINAEAGPPTPGYLAEVDVSFGGVTRHGRIIVSPCGCVHLEHLDEQARFWVSRVIGPDPAHSKGWNDRSPPPTSIQRVWCRIGQIVVLAEVHAPGGSIRISQHKLLATR